MSFFVTAAFWTGRVGRVEKRARKATWSSGQIRSQNKKREEVNARERVSGAIVPALAVAREASKRVGSKRKAREGILGCVTSCSRRCRVYYAGHSTPLQ